MWRFDTATLVVSNHSIVADNTGKDGGGILCVGHSRISIANESVVKGNTAQEAGGGLVAADAASVSITNGSVIKGNTAQGAGGGLVAADAASVSITGGVQFLANRQEYRPKWANASFTKHAWSRYFAQRPG